MSTEDRLREPLQFEIELPEVWTRDPPKPGETFVQRVTPIGITEYRILTPEEIARLKRGKDG